MMRVFEYINMLDIRVSRGSETFEGRNSSLQKS
jgi:hypothetical protein